VSLAKWDFCNISAPGYIENNVVRAYIDSIAHESVLERFLNLHQDSFVS
jgi:hypothetical protein